jgi:NNP family nitrate/nitrite transporter-like MFS transporter
MADTERSFRAALPWVVVLMGMVFFAIFPRLIFSPLLVSIADDLGLSYAEASGFFFYASIGFVGALLFSGHLSRYITHRWTIVAAVGITGGALLSASFAESKPALNAALVVAGVGSGLYPGSGIATLSAMVHARHRGSALAVHESGPNLAFVLAPVVVSLLLPITDWRGVLRIVAFASLSASAGFALFGRGGGERGEPPHFDKLRVFLRDRTFWVLALYFVLAASCAMGVFSVLPTFLIVDHGLGQTFVNRLVGLSRVSGFLAILVAGTLSDRLGIRVVIGAIFGITGTATLMLGLLEGSALTVAVFVQPMVVTSFFPAALAALAGIGPPSSRNLGVSLAIPLANFIGSGVVPPILGNAGEAGNFSLGFIVLGALVLGSMALLPLLQPAQRRAEVTEPSTAATK